MEMSGPIREFHKKHGSNYLITDEGRIIWSDGAYRENSLFGMMLEPNPDPHRRAKHIRWYWKVKLDRDVRYFDQVKLALRGAAGASIRDGAEPPSAGALENLKALKAGIKRTRAELEKAEVEVENSIPKERKQRQRQLDVQREAGQEFADKLSDIEV